MSNIRWQPVCCDECGAYAEHPTRDGGMARLKRKPDGNILVVRFGPDNRAIDADGDGVPDYVEMAEADALALLS